MEFWSDKIQEGSEHSQWYANRWEKMISQGSDINGEARLIDAIAPRNSAILDAGSGTGRVGHYLAAQGHRVIGVDLDPYLVHYAREHTSPPNSSRWFAADLGNPHHLKNPGATPDDVFAATSDAELQPLTTTEGLLPQDDEYFPDGPYDLIVSAGNVLPFIQPEKRLTVLRNLRQRLNTSGRLVIGFSLDRGWKYGEFHDDCAASGLNLDQAFESWTLDPFDPMTSGFIVAFLSVDDILTN